MTFRPINLSRALSLAVQGRRRRPKVRERSVVRSILASVAAIGLAAVVAAPAGMALAQQGATSAADAESVYSLASASAQTIETSAEAALFQPLTRGAFEVYVKPPPPPPPPALESAESSGHQGGGPVFYSGGGAPAEWMSAAGIAESDWGYVDFIAAKESGWNPNATNRSSGACGLIQAYPCSKVPGNGYDPVDNLRWADGYASARYGGWSGAYNFWINNHWW